MVTLSFVITVLNFKKIHRQVLIYHSGQTLSVRVILYSSYKNIVTVTANTLQQYKSISTSPMGQAVRLSPG
jgi:hypothetical protein